LFVVGLWYSTWVFDSLVAASSGDVLSSKVRVRYSCGRRGKQVVQVYAARPDSAVDRPVRWLAGFAVVTAEPGETVEVPVGVHARTLRHWDGGWAVEPGELTLAVGTDAGHLLASTTVAL
jgi:beta-glucosidase